MKLLIDTNVILDLVFKREGYQNVVSLFKSIADNNNTAYITALNNNIKYIISSNTKVFEASEVKDIKVEEYLWQ